MTKRAHNIETVRNRPAKHSVLIPINVGSLICAKFADIVLHPHDSFRGPYQFCEVARLENSSESNQLECPLFAFLVQTAIVTISDFVLLVTHPWILPENHLVNPAITPTDCYPTTSPAVIPKHRRATL